MSFWVHDSGSYKEVSDVWVHDGGSYKQANSVWKFDSGSWSRCFIRTVNPSSLTAVWDGQDCGFDLDWQADSNNTQDIWRCTSTNCTPQSDGSVIDTVAAGVSHYDDNAPGENSGDYAYQIKSTQTASNIDDGTSGMCVV